MQIRTGMRSSWLAAVAVAVATGLLSLLPSGCGGGGGTPLPGTTPTPVGATPTPTPLRFAAFRVQVDWGARSRVVGLSSAQSARITLAGGTASGADLTWTVNRPAGTAAVTQVYDSPSQARVGTSILTIRFFANPDGTGAEVGIAQASATILPDGSLTVTISTYTGVQTVQIIADGVNNSVEVGETKDLAVTARNAQGVTVAVTPGSVFFTVVEDPQNLAVVNGGSSVRGTHPISARVTARIDTATSAPTLINVTSGTSVEVSPVTATIGSEYPLDLTATVLNAPAAESDVTWSIVGGAGLQNGTLTNIAGNTVRYLAPKVLDKDVRTIKIIATSKYNTTRTAMTTVTVNAPGEVVITPGAVALSWEQSIDLSAVVNNLSSLIPANSTNRQVKWELEKQGILPVGTFVVDPADPNKITYTAPKRDATIKLLAISNYDSTKLRELTIQVTTLVAVSITEPNPLTDPFKISVAKTQNFAATVANIPPGKNNTVAWSVEGPAGEPNTGNRFGTINATTGLYTAPLTQPGTGLARIKATSNYDASATKFATIQIVGGSIDIKIQ